MVDIRKPFEEIPHEGCIVEGVSMTEQHHKESCDVNTIVKRHLSGELVPQLPQGSYEDLPDATSFEEAMLLISEANEAFDGLGSDVRKRFGNDPRQLLEFMGNADNSDEAIQLGLAVDRDAVLPPADPAAPTETASSETSAES